MLEFEQIIGIVIDNLKERIGAVFPVYEVFRLQDGSTWHVEHRSADHIISVVNTDEVDIREVTIDDWVDELVVTQVTCPLMGICHVWTGVSIPILVPLETGTATCLVGVIIAGSQHLVLEGRFEHTILVVSPRSI